MEDNNIFNIKRAPARSTFFAFTDVPGDSRITLNGQWKFRWTPTPDTRIVDFYQTSFDDSSWKTLAVPAVWEVNGYGTPIYSSSGYTFKVNPPFVMEEPKETYTSYVERNPTGQYRRTITVPMEWISDGGRTFLRFDGAMSAYKVWVNGQFAGYSEGSNEPAEFDITPLTLKPATYNLQPGAQSPKDDANKILIAIEVNKYCAGSYLEDQDAWRFGGIHRDVTLYHTPALNLRDYTVRTVAANSDYTDFRLQIQPKLQSFYGDTGEGYIVEAMLTDAEGNAVCKLQEDVEAVLNFNHKAGIMNEWFPQRGRMKFERMDTLLHDVRTWTAETPYLYTLRLSLVNTKTGKTTQQTTCKVGFRDLKIHDGMFLVNGKPVRMRGVNRGEHDPLLARQMTEERMLQDIRLMKACNINAVRTSHYPSHPRWYELCDSLGLYILDETGSESHGVRGEITSTPDWNTAMMDRVIRMAERDKNHPSVIMWSLGNESGFGSNHAAMAGWLHEFDPTRFVHYEGAQGTAQYKYTTDSIQVPDPLCVDVISRFYPRVKEEYLNPGMPEGSDKERAENARWEFLLDIAKHPATYSTVNGTMKDMRPVMTSEYAHCMGNALGNFQEYWDEIYSNQRMMGGFIWDWADQGINTDGKGVKYGGDFGDKPNLKAFCLNGIVKCDRTTTAKYEEVKHVYSPVQFAMHDGQLWVINRNHHVSLGGYAISAYISANGKKTKSQSLSIPDVAPGDSAMLDCTQLLAAKRPSNADVRLCLTVRNGSTGDFVSDEQFPLSGSVMHFKAKSSAKSIAQPVIQPCFYRAPTDNDKSFGNWIAKEWKINRVDTPEVVTLNDKQQEYRFGNGSVVVTTETQPLKDGSLDVVMTFDIKGNGMTLPRLGMQIMLPKEYENLEYYGRGPWDNYPDRWRSCHVGLWNSTVSEQYEHYPVPQDSGNHTECSYVRLTNKHGKAFTVTAVDAPFSFSALHYTPQEIASVKHDYELKEGNHTVLTVNCALLGIGNSSCGPGVLRKYTIDNTKRHTLHVNIK